MLQANHSSRLFARAISINRRIKFLNSQVNHQGARRFRGRAGDPVVVTFSLAMSVGNRGTGCADTAVRALFEPGSLVRLQHREQQVVAPVPGNAQVLPGIAFFREAALAQQGCAGNVFRQAGRFQTVQPEIVE